MADKAIKPTKAQVRVELSNDREVICITFPLVIDQQDRDVTIPMNARSLDSFLHSLGLLRAKMIAKHPHRRPQGETVSELNNPDFMTWPNPLTAEPVLSIHHSSFGWLSFAFAKERAMQIGKALQAYAALTPAPARPPARKH